MPLSRPSPRKEKGDTEARRHTYRYVVRLMRIESVGNGKAVVALSMCDPMWLYSAALRHHQIIHPRRPRRTRLPRIQYSKRPQVQLSCDNSDFGIWIIERPIFSLLAANTGLVMLECSSAALCIFDGSRIRCEPRVYSESQASLYCEINIAQKR